MGNLTSMRKEIFPGLARAYNEWFETNDTEPLFGIAELGARHWERLAREMIAIHQDSPREAPQHIRSLVAASYL